MNAVLFLHGLGDTNASFTALAMNLSLPETVCISLQGHTPLPFDLGGFHWGDDILFDEATGQMEFDTGFDKARRIIYEEVIETGLIKNCGFRQREIMLFGFGQGGMSALAVAASSVPRDDELGGVISVGGPLPSGVSIAPEMRAKTPVLILGGSSSTLITSSALSAIRQCFAFVEYKKWPKPNDSMPHNRDEMLPIMQFFARRLRSRAGIPSGSVELS